jgi:hypothetical protein
MAAASGIYRRHLPPIAAITTQSDETLRTCPTRLGATESATPRRPLSHRVRRTRTLPHSGSAKRSATYPGTQRFPPNRRGQWAAGD